MAHRCGLYRALVVNNADPDGRGRLQIACPQLWGSAPTDWVEGCFAPNIFQVALNASAGTGDPARVSLIPAIGQQVWITFEGGDEDHPVWLGTPLTGDVF